MNDAQRITSLIDARDANGLMKRLLWMAVRPSALVLGGLAILGAGACWLA